MPVYIDYGKCTGCKRCYDLCPMDVFVWDTEINMPRAEYTEVCWHCGICYMECPKRAMEYIFPPSMW